MDYRTGYQKTTKTIQGSRAVRSVFGHIHCRITSHEEKSKSNSNMKWGAVLTNLLNIQPTMERHTHLSLAHVNAQSIGNKICPFLTLPADKKSSYVLSQIHGSNQMTWCSQEKLLHPDMTSYPNQESDRRQGGGVALVYSSSLKVHNITQGGQQGGPEYMNIHAKFRNKTLNLYTIYRHPNTSVLQFFKSLANHLEEKYSIWPWRAYTNWGFPYPDGQASPLKSILFNDFLDTFNLTNKVTFSTHLSQHTIDPNASWEPVVCRSLFHSGRPIQHNTQTKRKTSIL